MSKPNLDKMYDALRTIGQDETLRSQFVELCRTVEARLARPGFSVRDEITGPLIDALHADVGVLRKQLSTGFVFDFHYRSKIAREFVMSVPAVPDHVWEPQTSKLLVHLAKGAKNVVIGGAYFGDHALLVAREIAADGGVVHAFELNPEQADMLERNAGLNGLGNVRVNRIGLWNDERSLLELVGDDSFAHAESGAAQSGKEPNTTTVDGYVRRNGIPNVDLIMLDIEGAELPALEGARAQLAMPKGKAPNVVFEVHRSYVDWSSGLGSTPIVRLMRDAGYHVFSVRDYQENRNMATQPIELISPETTYLEGPPHGFNMLAVKDLDVLDAKTFRFVDGVSPKLLAHKAREYHHPIHGRE